MHVIYVRIIADILLRLSYQGNCFGQPFDDEEGGEGGDDDDEDDDDMVDGNVAYASCDLVGAYAKVSGSVGGL